VLAGVTKRRSDVVNRVGKPACLFGNCLQKRHGLVLRQLRIAQDLPQQPPPDDTPGMDGNGHDATIIVAQPNMASSLSRLREAGLLKCPAHFVRLDCAKPVHLSATF